MKIYQPQVFSEQGQRQNQEDSVFPPIAQATRDTRFFVVCDGMGGHQNGEIASNTVCRSFAAFLENAAPDDFNQAVFEQALAFAYAELDKNDTAASATGKMGTTLTFLHLNDREAFMAHIGDSRIYQVRTKGGNARIVYKSSDHSLVNELMRAGVITPGEAIGHPKKNVITRAMQPHLDTLHKADIHTTQDVKAGDYFFLCTDGVLESVDDDKLLEILSGDTGSEQKIAVIRQLCESGSKDNFSAYLIPVEEGIDTAKAPVQIAKDLTPEKDADSRRATTDPPAANPQSPQTPKIKVYRIIAVVLLIAAIIAGTIYFAAKPKHRSPQDNNNPSTERADDNNTPADNYRQQPDEEYAVDNAGDAPASADSDSPAESVEDKRQIINKLKDGLSRTTQDDPETDTKDEANNNTGQSQIHQLQSIPSPENSVNSADLEIPANSASSGNSPGLSSLEPEKNKSNGESGEV